jgi:hypothetical protein
MFLGCATDPPPPSLMPPGHLVPVETAGEADAYVAANGSMHFMLVEGDGQPLTGKVTGPFQVSRADDAVTFTVTSTGGIGGGLLTAVNDTNGLAPVAVFADRVDRIELTTPHYQLSTDVFVDEILFDAERKPEVQVALIHTAGNRRLVDASLTSAGNSHTAWDTFAIASNATQFDVASASIAPAAKGQLPLPFGIVARNSGGIENLVAFHHGDRTCFNVTRDAIDVVANWQFTFEGGGAVTADHDNCITAPDGAKVTARARDHQITVTLPI